MKSACSAAALHKILKSPLMNIKKASGSQQLRYRFTKRPNVCVFVLRKDSEWRYQLNKALSC